MIARSSPEWPPLKEWLEQQRAEKLDLLADPSCTIKEADLLRGELRLIRTIISAVEPPRMIVHQGANVPGAGY